MNRSPFTSFAPPDRLQRPSLSIFIGLLICVSSQLSTGQVVEVPGRSRLWLVDQPLTAQSPLQVQAFPISPGQILTFQASGLVSHGGGTAASGPEGVTGDAHAVVGGAQNGISDIVAPFNALIGVFLGNEAAAITPAPEKLFFGWNNPNRDYQRWAPELKQVFYIGQGTRSDGSYREVVVPTGATRLYLGTMDTQAWSDNSGSYSVHIQVQKQNPVQFQSILSPSILITGRVGRKVAVEYRESVEETSPWHTLTQFTLTSSPFTFCDPSSSEHAKRFYRVTEITP